jgi:hypothetical protein
MTEPIIPESYPKRKEPIALFVSQAGGEVGVSGDLRKDGSDIVDSSWFSLMQDRIVSSRRRHADHFDFDFDIDVLPCQ